MCVPSCLANPFRVLWTVETDQILETSFECVCVHGDFPLRPSGDVNFTSLFRWTRDVHDRGMTFLSLAVDVLMYVHRIVTTFLLM